MEKKQNFVGFSGANSRKNRPISGIFAGKKSKFVEKSADFAGFSRKNVKFRRIFRGKFLEKSADFFHGKFGGETKTKTADFTGFLVGNFAKIDQFCVDMTSVG